MSSSSTQPPADRSDGPRLNSAWKALLWTVVIALAVAPYPWWW
jgi:hypothetical protein